jgi:ABC-type sugar transport system ATPase subunit
VTAVTERDPQVDEPALELRDVTKAFGHVTALSGASLVGHHGEVLGIVGDNGAGKSTLIKTISGVHRPDAGEIRVRGQAMSFHSPADARRVGIATVFQDLALVEVLDVATNMFLGQFPTKHRWFVNRKAIETQSRAVLDDLGVTVRSIRTQIGMLSGGQRQIVAIARAMRSDADVVLLDEPTAALGVRETAHAADLVRSLRRRGTAVILISHDLNFVFDVADRIQVMRLGRVAGVRLIADTSKEEVVGLITGTLSGTSPREATS